MATRNNQPLERRSFLGRAGIGAAAAAVGLGHALPAQAQTGGARFQPARHAQDDWLDAVPGKHRLFLDGLTGPGAGDALLFAGNFMNGNKSAYQLADTDSAVVICLRHFATPFAWTDAVWAKYGAAFTQMTKLNDPKTGKAPVINLYATAGYGLQLNNLGTTSTDLIKRGVQFAVCDTASHFFAQTIAEAMKTAPDAVYKDFRDGTIANAHYVVAGIVTTNRAQERGYTLAHCG